MFSRKFIGLIYKTLISKIPSSKISWDKLRFNNVIDSKSP